MTRIRNWTDRVFYRPDREVVYRHIDQLFGEPGQNVIDWQLILTHWRDLMRIVISIREGRLSSTLLLRRLSGESRRNNVYKAFRELGRAICTITLLRLISEPELRAHIDAATNKVESYNNFSGWLAFGSEQIEGNDPAEQEKIIKFNTLLANCVLFQIAVDMSRSCAACSPKAAPSTSMTSQTWPPTSPSGSSGLASTPSTGSTSRRKRSTRSCNSTPPMSPTSKSERPDLRAILHIALDITDVVRGLQATGCVVDADDLATMSPYITERVKRFGE